jgi:hypothetical protein
MKRYAVVIEKAESNYAAYVPDLPGCVATGATREETEQRLREASNFTSKASSKTDCRCQSQPRLWTTSTLRRVCDDSIQRNAISRRRG